MGGINSCQKAYIKSVPILMYMSIGLRLLLIGLILIVASSGCVNIDPEAIALANPMIKKFMEEHPNAEVVITHLSQEEVSSYIDAIREDCGNPYIDATEMYKINITDPDSGLYAVVWLNWEDKVVECAIKYGNETEVNNPPSPGCQSHATYACYSGQVYWYDSCGSPEEVKKYCSSGCENGACKPACTSQHEAMCYDGDLYWYNSCGSREEKKEECGEGCKNGACLGDCTSHDDTICYEGHVYWTDSCGTVEEKKEHCEYGCSNGECRTEQNCTSHYEAKCYNNDLYWFDSCGEKEDKKEECPNGCEEGVCIEGGCIINYEAKCYANDLYWYDSCGTKGNKKEECEIGCYEGSCIHIESYCGDGLCSGNLILPIYTSSTITIDSLSYDLSPSTYTGEYLKVFVDGEYSQELYKGNSYTVNGLSFYLADIYDGDPNYYVFEFDEEENPRSCPEDCGLQFQTKYCEDTDYVSPEPNSWNYKEKGELDSHLGTFEDYCFDETTLYEWSCINDALHEDELEVMIINHCKCSDGACETKYYQGSEYDETDMYYDSDKGIWVSANIFEKGTVTTPDFTITDYCQNDFTLRETTPQKSSAGFNYGFSTVFCPGQCVDGVCQTATDPTCTDHDFGKNYYRKSILSSNYATFTDYCENDIVLVEGICGDGSDAYASGDYFIEGKEYAKYVTYACPKGCYDGACIETLSSATFNIMKESWFNESETKTISAEGYSYDVNLVGVANSDAVVAGVNGTTGEIERSETREFTTSNMNHFGIHLMDTNYVGTFGENEAWLGFGPEMTLEQGEAKTIYFEGETYDIHLLGVSSEQYILISINDYTNEHTKGLLRSHGGFIVFVKDVYYVPS
jgi:hypothetical protein